MYKQDSQAGVGAIGTVLTTVLVGLLAVVIWLAYQQHNRVAKAPGAVVSTPSPTPAPTIASGAYAGWKTGTLKYEKISFDYPADWSVKDDSLAMPKSQNGCTYPGHDEVTLVSPAGNQVSFNAGQDCFGDDAAKAFGAVPIKALGQDMYLVFLGIGLQPITSPSTACLAPIANPDNSFPFNSKNIFHNGDGGPPVNSFCYFPYDPSKAQGAAPTFTVAQIENSADYADAKMIFESMHY